MTDRQRNFIGETEATDRERFATIDAVTARFKTMDRTDKQLYGLTSHRWRNVAELLKAIHACSTAGVSHIERLTLAERLGCSPGKIDNATREAKRLGVLEVTPRYYDRENATGHKSRARISSEWRIVWPVLACLFSRDGHKVWRDGHKVCEANKRNSSFVSSFVNSSPLPPDVAEDRDEWRAVEEEVLRCGVDGNRQAVAAARRHGAEPADVRGLVAYWREHRDGFDSPAAALYRRLMRWSRDTPSDKGWRFNADYVTPAELAERNARAAERKRKRRQRDAAANETRARDQALERTYGDEVDRLDRSTAEAWLRESFGGMATPILAAWPRGEPPSGLARDQLLLAVAERTATV